MYGVITHPMTNIKECYDKVLAQSKGITEFMQEGQYTNDHTCWYHDFQGQRVAQDRIELVLSLIWQCTKMSAMVVFGQYSTCTNHGFCICLSVHCHLLLDKTRICQSNTFQ